MTTCFCFRGCAGENVLLSPAAEIKQEIEHLAKLDQANEESKAKRKSKLETLYVVMLLDFLTK